jgi:hypothetical protein
MRLKKFRKKKKEMFLLSFFLRRNESGVNSKVYVNLITSLHKQANGKVQK